MNGSSEKSFNVKASINGQELSSESLASVFDTLFKDGWLNDIVKSALSAQSAAMGRVKVDMEQHVQQLTEALQTATSRNTTDAAEER